MYKIFHWLSAQRQGWPPFFEKRYTWLADEHWRFLCIISVFATFIFAIATALLDNDAKYVPPQILEVIGIYTMAALLMIIGSLIFFVIILSGCSQFKGGRAAFDRLTKFQELTEIEKLNEKLDEYVRGTNKRLDKLETKNDSSIRDTSNTRALQSSKGKTKKRGQKERRKT